MNDQQLVKFINIFQPGSRLVRQFIFNLQLCRGAKTIPLGNIVLMWLLLEAITCCSIDSKNRFWDENEFFFKKVRENVTRKMTSCTRKTSNVAFQLCGLKRYGKMKCLMTSCTRKTSNVASYIRFTEF